MPDFHAEASQATACEGLVQGPYVAARAGFEPTILRMKGHESTNEAPRSVEYADNNVLKTTTLLHRLRSQALLNKEIAVFLLEFDSGEKNMKLGRKSFVM